LLAACSAASASAQQGTATPWITIVGQPPFIMPADSEAAAVPLLVTLSASAGSKDVAVALLDVRYEKLVDDRLTNQFSVDPSIDRVAGRGPSILVKVANVGALRPGEYQLRIGVKHPKLGQQEPLAVTIERPGVELEQPGKLSVDVLYGFWMSSKPTVSPQELRFTQTAASKFSRTSEVILYSTPFKMSGERPSQGMLDLHAKTPVAAGQPLIVSIVPRDFPAGTSGGSIEVRGVDLKAPRTVEIEVRARHSPGWVLVLIALGLLLGYLLRVLLQQRVELAKARAQSTDVADALEKALSRTQDKAFSDQVRAALADLRAAINGTDRAAIEQHATQANTVLTTAKNDLQGRLARTHERLRTFQAVGAPTANLPPEMTQLVRQTSEVCGRCAELLEKLDETRVRTALDALDRQISRDLVAVFARWQTALPSRLREMEQLRFAVQKASIDELVTHLKDLNQRVAQVAIPKDIAALGQALDTVDEIQAFTSARLAWLSEALAQDVAEFKKLFIDRNGVADSILDDIQLTASGISNQLAASSRLLDPGRPFYDAAERDGLRTALEKSANLVLVSQRTHLPKDDIAAVEDAIKQQRYFDALGSLKSAGTRLGVSAGTDTAAARPVFASPQEEKRDVPATEPVPTVPAELASTLKARTLRELARAELAQTLIAAILITGLGYVLFAEKFIGTLTDLATLFMWGFSLDVSINKLLEVGVPLTAKARQS
jgi:hypothetical protein